MIKKTTMLLSAFLLTLSPLLSWSCSNAPQKKTQQGDTKNAVKAAAPTLLSRTVYEVRVLPLGPVHNCESTAGCDVDDSSKVLVLAGGEIVMETMSNFSIKFVSGSVSILNNPALTIDLSKSLSQFAPDATQDTMSGNISSDLDGHVVMTKRIGNITFDPPRPLILGPIIQDPNDFSKIDKVYPAIHFKSTADAKGPAVAGTATIHLKVINARESYKPRPSAKFATAPFEVLHWEMSLDNSTAATEQNVQALLLNRIAFYWRTRPIQIPRLALDTDLGSLLGGKSDPNTQAIGEVRVILDAKEITSF